MLLKNKARRTVLVVAWAIAVLTYSPAAIAQTTNSSTGGHLIIIDFPGARQTIPVGINGAGQVTGYYVDAKLEQHGFIRNADGTFTSFDVPIAVIGDYEGTNPIDINLEGAVTGSFSIGNESTSAFYRYPSGNLVVFDVPGAQHAPGTGTASTGINAAGDAIGYFTDATLTTRGFIRHHDGSTETFSEPEASLGDYVGTNPRAINAAGTAIGYFSDPNRNTHGFLRSADGSYLAFDVPGSITGPLGTTPQKINAAGAIVGDYFVSGGASCPNNVSRGFVRYPDGAFATFAAGNPSLGCLNTYVEGINNQEVIVGYDQDANYIYHAFIRAADGTVTILNGPSGGPGSYAYDINEAGQVIGSYFLDTGVSHAFLWTPF